MRERWYGGWLRFRLLAVAGYVIATVVVLGLRGDHDGWSGLALAVLMPVAVLALAAPGVARAYDRSVHRSRPLGDELDGRLPGRALRRSGLRRLDVREDDGRLHTMGRTVRRRRQAVIVLPANWRELNDDDVDGLLLHEAAHVVRYDTDRSTWASGLLFVLVWFVLPQRLSVAVTVVLVVLAVAVVVAHNWWEEYAADAFVVEHGRPEAAHGFARYLAAAQRSPWQQTRARLTHPPDGWRVRRLVAGSGDDAAAQDGALR